MPRAGPSFETTTLFRCLEEARGVVLAVSGGPDSTALMHLVSRWRPDNPSIPISIASVDHGLRAGSAEDARSVAEAARGLAFDARVLAWDGLKPNRAVQERARAARYALLVSFAKDIGATHLVTAHTLDDQAETLLFRMARGSGLTGLGGMRAESERDGIRNVRPFLAIRKQALVDLCIANDWPFISDPANDDTRFARTRWRRLAPALATEGLTAERLGALALRLSRADAALCKVARAAAAACAVTPELGRHRYRAESLFSHPIDIVSRIIGTAVIELTGDDRLRLHRLEHLVDDVVACHAHKGTTRRTLHNCLISLDRNGVVSIEREGLRRRGSGL